ncbi:galectin-3-like [Mizuhopecten yessoensis]|uniref:galectin-3-like n=1 Tax=Mizuhopecten yessoensis TaxID=6573 RepID=UPI000B45BE1C|nr:galectin-3-like [Mizuhopecten yessoensis]
MGQVIGNRPVTSVTMVSQQTNQQATQGYATAQPGYPAAGQPAAYPVAGQPAAYPAAGQPAAYPAAGKPAAYPNSPMTQAAYPPAPAGQYPPPTQQAYPMGSQPYPAQPQATPYNAGNMYDNNTAPMAGGGGFINAGFQPPPPYDQVATEKK